MPLERANKSDHQSRLVAGKCLATLKQPVDIGIGLEALISPLHP